MLGAMQSFRLLRNDCRSPERKREAKKRFDWGLRRVSSRRGNTGAGKYIKKLLDRSYYLIYVN
jgi:hypothetical protein